MDRAWRLFWACRKRRRRIPAGVGRRRAGSGIVRWGWGRRSGCSGRRWGNHGSCSTIRSVGERRGVRNWPGEAKEEDGRMGEWEGGKGERGKGTNEMVGEF